MRFFDLIIPTMKSSIIQNGRLGLERGQILGFWTLQSMASMRTSKLPPGAPKWPTGSQNSAKNCFDSSAPSMRKVGDGETGG